MNHLKRRDIASNTLTILEKGTYQTSNGEVSIESELQHAVAQTRLFTPDDLRALSIETPITESYIEVMNETSLQGAKRLYDKGLFKRVMVLNFASAKNAGGGFLRGAQAQEETLARSSGLYVSLQQCPDYYDYHRRVDKSLLYSDHMIYSPACPVFKQDNGRLLDAPYYVDFITSPAPNRSAITRNDPKSLGKLEAVFAQRVHYMLTLAAHQQADALVLGAWGCGVFGNQPEQVASLFANELLDNGAFANTFRHISFSIPENPKLAANTTAFETHFSA